MSEKIVIKKKRYYLEEAEETERLFNENVFHELVDKNGNRYVCLKAISTDNGEVLEIISEFQGAGLYECDAMPIAVPKNLKRVLNPFGKSYSGIPTLDEVDVYKNQPTEHGTIEWVSNLSLQTDPMGSEHKILGVETFHICDIYVKPQIGGAACSIHPVIPDSDEPSVFLMDIPLEIASTINFLKTTDDNSKPAPVANEKMSVYLVPTINRTASAVVWLPIRCSYDDALNVNNIKYWISNGNYAVGYNGGITNSTDDFPLLVRECSITCV